MYPWVTHTWNPVRGKCPHDCVYCYMKRIPNIGDLRFVEKEMNTNLGQGNKIFMGSSCDIWAEEIPFEWQKKSLEHCLEYPGNIYILQTKNPHKWNEYNIHSILNKISYNRIIFGITVETNRELSWISKAPSPEKRVVSFNALITTTKFVSIEPIMDFDFDVLLGFMIYLSPDFVSIGADSGNNGLPEPPGWKIRQFIRELQQFTEVKIKSNLGRLIDE